MGISEPKDISYNGIKNYLLHHDLDTNNLFFLKTGCFYSLADSSYSIRKDDSSYSPIQYRVYEGKSGKFLGSWQICYGNLLKLGFLENVPPVDTTGRFIYNPVLSYQNDIRIIATKYSTYPNIGNYDYIIIAFWADYLGKPSRKMLYNLENYIKRHPKKRIYLMKVYLIEYNKTTTE